MGITIRAAVADDAPGICIVYNQGIEDRVATFETDARSPDDIAHWFGDNAHPVVVAEEDGQILGFAATSAYGTRECYAGIREFSIYVHREAKRRGTARMLLIALFDAAAKAGCWKITSRAARQRLGQAVFGLELVLGRLVVRDHSSGSCLSAVAYSVPPP